MGITAILMKRIGAMKMTFSDFAKLIIDGSSAYHYSKSKQDEMKIQAIKNSAIFHYQKNDYFRHLCEQKNFNPDDICSLEDLTNIPLIPQTYFKKDNRNILFSFPLDDTVIKIQSSGTSGHQSITYREMLSLRNISYGFQETFIEIFGLIEGACLFLTPSIAQAPNLGMLRTLGLLNTYLHTQFYAIDGTNVNFDQAVEFLNQWNGIYPRHIVGAPFMLSLFIDYLDKKNISVNLDKKSRILTTGGWKRYTGQMIPRSELDNKCQRIFNIQHDQIRDFYGCIESNILAPECSCHQKHIAPYAHFYTRDINNPDVIVPEGKEGLLCILDPLNTSFPGFLLTEDVVKLRFRECDCGRKSSILEFIGRAPNSDTISCAITLEQFLDNKIKAL